MSASDIKPAATILLLRDDPGLEVLMVKRHHQIDFASGALVFPGGKSHAGDHDLPWAEHAIGWEGFAACGSPPSARPSRRPASCWAATRPARRSGARAPAWRCG